MLQRRDLKGNKYVTSITETLFRNIPKQYLSQSAPGCLKEIFIMADNQILDYSAHKTAEMLLKKNTLVVWYLTKQSPFAVPKRDQIH